VGDDSAGLPRRAVGRADLARARAIAVRSRPVKNRESQGRQLHIFKDPGEAIDQADYQPRTYGIPEQRLAATFIEMKRDYGGRLPVDFALHAVLESRAGRCSKQGPPGSNGCRWVDFGKT
jgi:hypothetical protein